MKIFFLEYVNVMKWKKDKINNWKINIMLKITNKNLNELYVIY